MKKITRNLLNISRLTTAFLLALTSGGLLSGCSLVPVVLPAVGPNPSAFATAAPSGQLEVFSALEQQSEGDNPFWYQHSHYDIYTMLGKRVKRVNNTTGHYAEEPKVVTLPAGTYLIKAQANSYAWVEVPVLIRGGQLTPVYLDGSWKPTGAVSKADLAYAPDGSPIGWRSAEECNIGK